MHECQKCISYHSAEIIGPEALVSWIPYSNALAAIPVGVVPRGLTSAIFRLISCREGNVAYSRTSLDKLFSVFFVRVRVVLACHVIQQRSFLMARPLSRLKNITSQLSFSTSTRLASRSPAMESKLSPLTGLYQPNNLNAMYYGPGTVKAHLLDCLPSESSKAFIITGSSLANKTPLVKQVEELLGSKHHAGTFSKIGQHAPIKELDEATDQVKNDPTIDTIISIGGGSPIDSAKAISYRVHEKSDKFLTHITIPTSKILFGKHELLSFFEIVSSEA